MFPKGIDGYLPSERQNAAWLFALAWLSRDQECRFDHIVDWRHKRADSGSIAVGPTKEQLLIVVRAFLGIIEQEEMRLKSERVNLSERFAFVCHSPVSHRIAGHDLHLRDPNAALCSSLFAGDCLPARRGPLSRDPHL